MKITKLNATTQKSYYGKALVKECENGTIILQSYQTDVLKIENGNLIKLWDGYSVTTMNHINDFCRQFGYPTFNKKSWLNFDNESFDGERYIVKFCNGFTEWGGSQIFDTYDDAVKFCDDITSRINNSNRIYTWGDIVAI